MSFPFVETDAGRSKSRYKKEFNDCTVRAVALAFGIKYGRAHRILEFNGRERGEGFYIQEWAPEADIDGKKLEWIFFGLQKGQKRMNPVRFTEQFKTGRYIVKTAEHVFAIIDGVVYDTADDKEEDHKCIYGCWRVVDPAEQKIAA